MKKINITAKFSVENLLKILTLLKVKLVHIFLKRPFIKALCQCIIYLCFRWAGLFGVLHCMTWILSINS